jgi:two-component system, NarL family, nitrate/nitrite response regulator NarL
VTLAADLRVLIIADDPLVRAGLAGLVGGEAGCQVVGRAASTDDLPSAIQTYRPDVVLWDLGWNPGSALEEVTEVAPVMAPLVLLLPDEAHAAEAWSAGARGLLRRDVEPARLAAGLVAATQGLGVVDPSFIAALAPAAVDDEAASRAGGHGSFALAERLTPRELVVLRLMAEGLPNKTIALRLGISEHTVKFHVNAILGKLGVASRTEAVVHATRLGLILL